MKFILGGGLVALLARDILGSDWQIIPYGKSRFYTYKPPLVDNYVIKDSVIDQYMDQFALIPIYTKNTFSIGGQLTQNIHIGLNEWLTKVYGPMVPPQAFGYWRTHCDYFAYGDCLEIAARLKDRYIKEIIDNQEKLGKTVVRIKDQTITTDKGVTLPYDQLVSTIPIDILTRTMGFNYEFPARDMWCYHLKTDWDMEGAAHILVADRHIDFFKVTKFNREDYVFYSTEKIAQPGYYFMQVLGKTKFSLRAETHIVNSIPCGPIPDLEELKDSKIQVLGSLAAWDDCQDIGTVIKRLVKMS
jgi:hypothetical protein